MQGPTRDEAEEAVQTSANAAPDGPGGPEGDRVAAATRGEAGGRPGGISLRNLQTLSSFKSPVFRLYYASMMCQLGALHMDTMARVLLVYRISGSAAIIGLLALANALPIMFFSLFGGVGADRLQKKHLLQATQAASAALSLAIVLFLSLGIMGEDKPGSWWILIIVSLVQGIIMGFMMPARQAMIAEIVGEEQLMNAVSLNTFGVNGLRLMAPAAAGFLIDAFNFEAAYYVMTAMFVAAVLLMLPVPIVKIQTSGKKRSAIADLKEGLRYVWHERVIFYILMINLFMSLLAAPYIFLLPVFTEDILKVGASGMGLLISASGVGAMGGSLVMASMPNKKRGAVLVLGGGVLMGVALIAFSISEWWYLSMGIILFVGLGHAVRVTLANTIVMYYGKREYLGRMMSLMNMENGMTHSGVFVAGVMSDAIGVQETIGGMAAVMLVMSVMTFAFVPSIRRLD